MRLAVQVLIATALFAPPAQRDNIISRINASDDVAWLEHLATDHDAAWAVARPFSPKAVRGGAFIRLGAMGTPLSLAAARRVESAARTWPLLPATVSLADMPHPSGHMSDARRHQLLASVQMQAVTYGVLSVQRLGGHDLFLTMSATPGDERSWTRPVLTPIRAPYAITRPTLTVVDASHLRFDAVVPAPDDREGRLLFAPPRGAQGGPFSATFDLPAIRQDTDADGWTDFEERRLRTRPDNPDSDADGMADSIDVTPRHAPSPVERDDEEVRILQKAFFAAIGIHGSHDLLMVRGDSRPVQLWGSRGPLLFGEDRAAWLNEHGAAPPQLSWKLTSLDRGTAGPPVALVDFSDFIGALAAAGYTLTLRQLEGEWFVVDIRLNWIS